jgi:hypothetical protein
MNYTPAVVIDIVLNENSKYFSTVGGYNGVGTIIYKEINGKKYGTEGFAKPYFHLVFICIWLLPKCRTRISV